MKGKRTYPAVQFDMDDSQMANKMTVNGICKEYPDLISFKTPVIL